LKTLRISAGKRRLFSALKSGCALNDISPSYAERYERGRSVRDTGE
jgi:hypothetical protein